MYVYNCFVVCVDRVEEGFAFDAGSEVRANRNRRAKSGNLFSAERDQLKVTTGINGGSP
jgi:hypothetical protein